MPADNDRERDLHALRNMIEESQLLLETTELPEGRSKRAREVLTSALSLAESLWATSPSAIDAKLDDRVDFARLIKVYRATPEGERRYSPAEVVDTEVVPVIGNPKYDRVCTSHIERQNLTMRTQARRLTRLSNAFSKKWENLWAALYLHFVYYNFCRIHRSLRVTPAMVSGITDKVWPLEALLSH